MTKTGLASIITSIRGDLILTAVALITLIIATSLVSSLTSTPLQSRKNSTFLIPPQRLSLMTFGYNENAADSLWLRLIQDIDHCESKNSKGICEADRGWVFHMLDTITHLTPKFRAPYSFGATVLSVLVGDREGAREIFDRALENFPNDWILQYRAAYHSLEEMKNPERAAELLRSAGKNGAPKWVFSLASRLYTNEGKAALATSVLQDLLAQDPNSPLAERIRTRLNEVGREGQAKDPKNPKD